VLDPRTRIILFKMLNKNAIYEVNGCISTGKEVSIYKYIISISIIKYYFLYNICFTLKGQCLSRNNREWRT